MNLRHKIVFDEGQYDYNDEGELTCPAFWTPSWKPTEGQGQYHRPEYDMKSRALGHSEVLPKHQFAASIMQNSSTGHACLWRKFVVEPGPVLVACTAMVKSHEAASHGVIVGIDPYGGTDFLSVDVMLGNWWAQTMKEWDQARDYGRWGTLNTRTDAQGTLITVFLISRNDNPAKWAAAIFGDVEVYDSHIPAPPTGGVPIEAIRALQAKFNEQFDDLIFTYGE